nr:hypothetical transcript [Hymenolepis microstoma]
MRGVSLPFLTHAISFLLYPYGVAPFYSHRTPTLGFMAELQPASRDISSRKHTAGRYSSHSSTCAKTAYRFVWKNILQVKTCISGASCLTCTRRWNTTVSLYGPTV